MRKAPSAEQVILVDAHDAAIGVADKLVAHESGSLHRAFSIFIFDAAGRLLMQQRAAGKYHSGGLWSNTCCGHPRPGESTAAAAARRLREEMGFASDLERVGTFVYRAELGSGLVEHEFDHVFAGRFDGTPRVNPSEVDRWAWVTRSDLRRDLAEDPDRFTAWLRPALDHLGPAQALFQ